VSNSYQVLRKGAILIPTGPCDHLHIICSNPAFYPRNVKDCVLAVNLSTTTPILDYDKTCILQNGEHPFIKHDSYVFYKKAEILGVDSISRNIADGTFSTHQPFNDVVFERILSGFAVSQEVRPKIKAFYKAFCI